LWWRHPAIAEQGSHNGMFNSMLAPDRAGPLRRLKWRARKAWQLGIRPLLARFYPVLLALTALVAGPYLLSALDAQETRVLEDSSRNRRITIAIYQPPASTECTPAAPCPVALLSTGHGMKNGQYAFLARAMARLGYLVVGIQHEQPGDPELPFAGNMMVLRMPFWRTGVANLQFVRATLRHEYPQYDWDHLTLVGHSHGGDVSALLAREQPALVTALVTLDNRRYPPPAYRQSQGTVDPRRQGHSGRSRRHPRCRRPGQRGHAGGDDRGGGTWRPDQHGTPRCAGEGDRPGNGVPRPARGRS
jgi:hypothetical protein